MNQVFLGLGSNLGEKEQNIERAYELIESRIGMIQKKSTYYRSEPWGFDSQNHFVNTVIQIKTFLEAQDLLTEIKAIEVELGRTEKSTGNVYSDRVIDIDILFFNQEIYSEPELQVPHPEISNRLFVLVPLHEISPYFVDPRSSKNIKTLLTEKQPGS